MPAFKDSHDRQWTISLDGITLKELRDTHKIDLSDVVGSVYSQLKRDPATLTTAIAFLCADQIRDANLTPKKFSAAINGVVIDDAFNALWDAAKLFFPPSLWSVLSMRLEQEQATQTEWIKMKPWVTMLNQPEIPTEIKEQIFAMIGNALPNFGSFSSMGAPSVTGLDDTPPNAAMSLPDSAESTRAA